MAQRYELGKWMPHLLATCWQPPLLSSWESKPICNCLQVAEAFPHSILEFRFEPQGVFHLSHQFLSHVVHLCGNIGAPAKAHLPVSAGSKWTSWPPLQELIRQNSLHSLHYSLMCHLAPCIFCTTLTLCMTMHLPCMFLPMFLAPTVCLVL